jgi:excisionase family DNA binding protein
MDKKKDEVMTIDELATYLKVSKSTLYKLVQSGKVPGQKIGKHWRFKREVIDKWFEPSSALNSIHP